MDPFDEIARMHREIDSMFQKAFHNTTWPVPHDRHLPQRIPISDVEETEKSLVARFELPGVDKKDIKLHVGIDYIDLKVESKKQSQVKEKDSSHYTDRYLQFSRHLTLPATVAGEQAEAEYKDGILMVSIPKKDAADKLVEIK